MIKNLDRYIALEMCGLWIVEFIMMLFILYFVLDYDALPVTNDGAGADELNHLHMCWQAILYTLTISLLSVAIGLYRADICARRSKFLMTALTLTVILAPAIATLTNIIGLSANLPNNLIILSILSGWIVSLAVTRLGFHLVQRFNLFTRKVLVIGSAQSAVRIQNIINASGENFVRLVGNLVLPPSGPVSNAPTLSALGMAELRGHKIWGVVLANDAANASPREDLGSSILSFEYLNKAYLFDEAEFCENRLQRLDIDALPLDWDDIVAKARTRRWANVGHRALDIIISGCVLLLTLPLMAFIALAIRLETSGPVFYSQERVGQNGKLFMLRKFRSMSVDAERLGKPVWAAQNDPRVTKVGRFIRSTRFDELPQLINVLAGDMSFIGPRPERPHFVEALLQAIPHYADRNCLKPGITGWAQVRFPYGASVEDARMKLAYDLYYIKHRSLLLHLMILASTFRVILFQEGSR